MGGSDLCCDGAVAGAVCVWVRMEQKRENENA